MKKTIWILAISVLSCSQNGEDDPPCDPPSGYAAVSWSEYIPPTRCMLISDANSWRVTEHPIVTNAGLSGILSCVSEDGGQSVNDFGTVHDTTGYNIDFSQHMIYAAVLEEYPGYHIAWVVENSDEIRIGIKLEGRGCGGAAPGSSCMAIVLPITSKKITEHLCAPPSSKCGFTFFPPP